MICPGSFSVHLHFQFSFWYSVLIHSIAMSETSQSIFHHLILFMLYPELFSDMCISYSVSLGLSHYCCQEFRLSCLYFTFLPFTACACLHYLRKVHLVYCGFTLSLFVP
jgi:hypothetical protein